MESEESQGKGQKGGKGDIHLPGKLRECSKEEPDLKAGRGFKKARMGRGNKKSRIMEVQTIVQTEQGGKKLKGMLNEQHIKD